MPQSLNERTPLISRPQRPRVTIVRSFYSNLRSYFNFLPTIMRLFHFSNPSAAARVEPQSVPRAIPLTVMVGKKHTKPKAKPKGPLSLDISDRAALLTPELLEQGANFVGGLDYIDVDTVNKNATPQERFALIALKQVFDNVRPLQGWEFTILLSAITVAIGAVSTSKDFGDHFIEGVESATGKHIPSEEARIWIEWVVAISNFTTQFSLTTKSFIHVVCRLRRLYNLPNHEFIKALTTTEKRVLFGVMLTGFASAKMIFDTWTSEKYDAGPAVSLVLAGLGYTSSTIINGNFTFDRLVAFHGDRYDLAVIRLLTQAKITVNAAANLPDSDLFIEMLSKGTWFRELNYRNNLLTELEQLESIITQLMNLTPTTAGSKLFDPAKRWAWLTAENFTCVTLATIASFMNFKAGLGVPHFISFGLLPLVLDKNNNMRDFNEWNADYILSVLLGFFVFGATSQAVNTIINTRACQDLMSFLKGIPAVLRGGLANTSFEERALFGMITFLSFNYAIGKAGSTLIYKLIQTPPAPMTVALVTLNVYFGLGILAMRGAVASGRNRNDWYLLNETLTAPSLLHHYNTLTPDKKQTLRRLLLANFNLTIDGLYGVFNQLNPNITGKDLFTAKLNDALEEKFGVNAKLPVLPIQIQTPAHPASPSSPLSASTVASSSPFPVSQSPELISATKKAEAVARSASRLGFGEGITFFSPGTTTPLRSSNSDPDLSGLESVPSSPMSSSLSPRMGGMDGSIP